MGHIIKSVSEGFTFAISVKRIIPYLIINLLIIFSLINVARNVMGLVTGGTGPFGLLLSLGILIPILIIIGLAGIWVNGAIIDQAKYYPRKRPLDKSFGVSTSRYWTMFVTAILAGIINFIVSFPPYIGYLLSFVVTLIFFYLYPAIIIDEKGCIDSFKRSFKTFMMFPLETFVTWLLTVIISLIIIGIFLLPLIFYFAASFVSILPLMRGTVDETLIRTEIIPMLGEIIRSPYIIPYIIIFAIGLAFISVFYVGTQARLYMNFRKREV